MNGLVQPQTSDNFCGSAAFGNERGDTMKELKYSKVFLFLTGLTLATLAVYGVISLRTGTRHAFLIWNLFLAWIPFGFSMAAYGLSRKTTGIWLLLPFGAAWLLFYPNAPYLMTDLVHLTVKARYYLPGGAISSVYWYDLTVMLLFTWTGWLTGFFSMYQIQAVVRRRLGAATSWAFVLAGCVLGGYGVLLGRVYRLNSWDILTDLEGLMALVAESLNRQSLFFSLFVAFILLAIYGTLYLLINGLGSARDDSLSFRK